MSNIAMSDFDADEFKKMTNQMNKEEKQDDVTHEQFFGENIKRVMNTLNQKPDKQDWKEKRWSDTNAFVVTCDVISSVLETDKLSIVGTGVNTIQDLLLEKGYAIQPIQSQIAGMNKEDKKDWKERLKEFRNGENFYGFKMGWDRQLDWIDSKIIQPLQSQNEALQKEKDELQEDLLIVKMINRKWETDYQKLQKEVEGLKLDYEKAENEIGRLQKQLETDENWRE